MASCGLSSLGAPVQNILRAPALVSTVIGIHNPAVPWQLSLSQLSQPTKVFAKATNPQQGEQHRSYVSKTCP